MSRSLLHLFEIVKALEDRNVELKSLRENIDTSTAMGRGFLSIMGVISQMEWEIKAERATWPKPEEKPVVGLVLIQISWSKRESSIRIQIRCRGL